MVEGKYTLSKEERLSWKRYIDLLFDKGNSFVAFPLRVIFLPLPDDEKTVFPVRSSMLISVSKKKFKRAVKRNSVKRLVREAYRLRKPELLSLLEEKDKRVLLAFIYMDKEIRPFSDMEKAMDKTIRLLGEKL